MNKGQHVWNLFGNLIELYSNQYVISPSLSLLLTLCENSPIIYGFKPQNGATETVGNFSN